MVNLEDLREICDGNSQLSKCKTNIKAEEEMVKKII